MLTQRPGQHEDLIVSRVVELLATVTSLLHLTTLHTAANQLRGQCRSRRWVESTEVHCEKITMPDAKVLPGALCVLGGGAGAAGHRLVPDPHLMTASAETR